MKVGDTLEVSIANMVVATAEITEVDNDNNTVTIVIPPTQVIMQTATTVTAPRVKEPEKETVITGVDAPVVESPTKEVPTSEPAVPTAADNPADTGGSGGSLQTVESSAGTETVNTD